VGRPELAPCRIVACSVLVLWILTCIVIHGQPGLMNGEGIRPGPGMVEKGETSITVKKIYVVIMMLGLVSRRFRVDNMCK